MRWRRSSDLAVFHDFVPPPTGGGSQFLRALVGELEASGLRVARNRIPPGTRACLFNSFNFDFERLRGATRPGVRLVHRVDGPVQAVRGTDDGTDARIAAINAELADATILQSRYSLERHRELGLELRDPTVIVNAPDPAIFNSTGRADLAHPVRVITSSWSDNPRKGGPLLRAIEQLVDPERYTFTFVGRTQERFERVRVLPPLPSEALAGVLREHHVFLAPFRDDPCSNALLEGLACGLPAVYLASGGNGELAGEAGLPFSEPEEVPELLDRLAGEWRERQAAVAVPTLADVTARYREVLGL